MISASELVVTGSERRGRPKAIQPGDREWVTAILGIRAYSNTYIFITLSIYIHTYIHMDINRGLMHTYLSIHMKHLARPYYSRLLNELDG